MNGFMLGIVTIVVLDWLLQYKGLYYIMRVWLAIGKKMQGTSY